MTVWVAFLRAVNVGKRQMKMAELKALCEDLGYEKVKTILASGNVRFETDKDPKAELEVAIEKRWGFFSEAVMRSGAAIEAMRYGAYHYISKDFEFEGVGALVANASERQDLSRHVLRLRADNNRAALPHEPIMKKWWDYMADLMLVHPDNRPQEWPLVPVFHFAGQPK